MANNRSLDQQMPPAENLAAMRVALPKNSNVTVRELTGLNHFFQTAKTGATGEYEGSSETFAPSAMELVGDWILKRFGANSSTPKKH
jgi:uncharacterized protein